MATTVLLIVALAVTAYAERTDVELPEEALGCEDGFTNIAGNCYRFAQQTQSWNDARATCQGQGAKLVSVLNDAQYNGLLSHINNNFPGTYWTSGATESGRWIWTATGGSMEQKWWGRNPGNSPNQCAYFCSNTLKYWNKQCSAALRFICEKPEEFQVSRVPAV
ncbi:lithostathine-1-beta [Cherax quadricarinatus]|nr:dromaiocalcin-2-like [Cherax quadricarinatus]